MNIKCAFIKQLYDVFGPWSSIRWEETTPEHLFNAWPGKATLWEMTCLLNADWYIIPQKRNFDYTHDAVFKYSDRSELIAEYTKNIIDPTEIPFEEYDLIISLDPILDVPKNSKSLFAYYLNEHWDSLYTESLKTPLNNYDLFLAHMMDAENKLSQLPQSVAFPYLYAPDIMQLIFQHKKQDTVWVDWRTLAGIANTDLLNETCVHAAKELENIIGLPVTFKWDFNQIPYGISNPPLWGDGFLYFDKLAKCKYYISNKAAGAGQGLCDAASLGCICIGEQDRVYHQLICHPACLCKNITEISQKLNEIIRDQSLQDEIKLWQDTNLRNIFIEKPLLLFEKAIDMKHNGQKNNLQRFLPENESAV